MELSITTERQADKVWLALQGWLVNETAPQLEAEFEQLVDHDGMTVVLDLSNLQYIASAGLRCIFKIKNWLRATGGKLVVLNPGPQVKKVLDIVRAIPPKSIFKSIEELDQYLHYIQSSVTDANQARRVTYRWPA